MTTSSGSDLNYCKLRMPETKNVCESRIVEISMSGLMRGAGVIPPLLLYRLRERFGLFLRSGEGSFSRAAGEIAEEIRI